MTAARRSTSQARRTTSCGIPPPIVRKIAARRLSSAAPGRATAAPVAPVTMAHKI
jgi:hypothetical protein